MGRQDKPGVSQKTCLCNIIHSFRGLKLGEGLFARIVPFLVFLHYLFAVGQKLTTK